jgi:hypothetical protein
MYLLVHQFYVQTPKEIVLESSWALDSSTLWKVDRSLLMLVEICTLF